MSEPAAQDGRVVAIPVVAIESLRKSYGDHAVLKGVDLQIRRGAAKFIIGPSGCGKSTLLRCINLLENADGGSLSVNGRRIEFGPGRKMLSEPQKAHFRRNIGMVFQQFYLFPHMTALQNVMEGPVTVKKLPRPEASRQAKFLLEKVGLSDKMNARPNHLSGGQQQRVAIARALAMAPDVMLFDEPTSALDPELVGEVLKVIQGLIEDGMTLAIVTHEMAFAREMGADVVFMEGGQIQEEGLASDLLSNPRSARLQQFLRRFSGHRRHDTGKEME